jgi:hypothetical protein
MRLALCVPGLLLPREILADTVFDLTAPGLALLLGRGRRQAAGDWLAQAFGVSSPPPAAALRKVGAGGTAAGSWLCLDPVHLKVAREGISLGDPAELGITDGETGELIEALQPIFADWGTLSASSVAHWELQLNRPLELHTRPLAESIGRPVSPSLPDGDDGREWRRLLAEAQTVLHAHPVNRSREALGRPLINSVWPWGAGALPITVQCDFDVVWSDDPVVAGLCALAGTPCLMPPERHEAASGDVLAVVGTLTGPARALDALRWRDALLALENDWIAPALAALKRGECAELTLIGTGTDTALPSLQLAATRGDLRRLWRRPRPLAALGDAA